MKTNTRITKELVSTLAVLDFKNRLRVLLYVVRTRARLAWRRVFSARTFYGLITKNRLLPLQVRVAAADRLLIELLKAVGKGE